MYPCSECGVSTSMIRTDHSSIIFFQIQFSTASLILSLSTATMFSRSETTPTTSCAYSPCLKDAHDCQVQMSSVQKQDANKSEKMYGPFGRGTGNELFQTIQSRSREAITTTLLVALLLPNQNLHSPRMHFRGGRHHVKYQ